MFKYGSTVCSIAMALQSQGLKVNGLVADPLSLNNYLKLWNWNGETDNTLWDIVTNLGLKYSQTVSYSDLNTLNNYIAKNIVLVKFFSQQFYNTYFYPYYYSDANIVGLAINTFTDRLIVQNPYSKDPNEVMITFTNVREMYIFSPAEPTTCSPEGCVSDPCSCDIFKCPFRREENTASCDIFQTVISASCQADSTLADFSNFLKCSIKSCSCPYFYLEDNQSCSAMDKKRRVFIGPGIPIDTYSSELYASGNLGSEKLKQIRSYSSITDQKLLGQMFMSGTGINAYEEDEIITQYYWIIQNSLAKEIPEFSKFSMPLQVASMVLYMQNTFNTTRLTSSKLWKAVKEQKWDKVLKAVSGAISGRVPSENLKHPRLMENLITSSFTCGDSPFADVLILRNTNGPDYYEVPNYNSAILNLLTNLNIGAKSLRVGLASFSTGFSAHTSGFSSDKTYLIQQYLNQMQSNYYYSTEGSLSQVLIDTDTFFSNNPRSSGAATNGGYPKIVVLFTGTGSGSFQIENVEYYYKTRGIQIIIFTTSTSTSDLDTLKIFTSNNASYSISLLAANEPANIVNNYAKKYTMQPNYAELTLFKQQMTYIKVPIPSEGITVRVASPIGINTVKAYASSVFTNPNQQFHDSVGINQGDVLYFSQNAQTTRRILANGLDGQDFLYIGLESDTPQTVVFSMSPGVTLWNICPENCETCDARRYMYGL